MKNRGHVRRGIWTCQVAAGPEIPEIVLAKSSNRWKNCAMNFQSLESRARGRPLAALLALLIVPLAVGLLITPWFYNPVRRHFWKVNNREAVIAFRFEKVAQRAIMIAAIFMMAPLIRYAGLGPKLRRAARLDAAGRRALARATSVGFVSMAAIYGGGWAFGVYEPEDYLKLWPAIAKCATFIVGAVFVGFFEEIFFRGFVFGALRARLHFWVAAGFSSAFYSIIHYMKPLAPYRIRGAKWDQGLRLLPHTFASLEWSSDWAAIFTLFVMGLTLCVIYERRGHLAWCIGLHGGWVLAMQIGNYLLGRDREFLVWWFSTSDYIVNAPAVIPVMLAFFLWSLTLPKKE